MKKNTIQHIKEDIPIVGYDTDIGCFLYQDGQLMDMYHICSKDMDNSDQSDIEMDCFKWAKFYKTYGKDIKIITLMFPCDTKEQQNYWKRRQEMNKNPEYVDMINRKLEELVWREKNTSTKEFYLMCFFDSIEDAKDSKKKINAIMGIGNMGLLEEMAFKKKELVLFKLANKTSLIF